MQLIRAKKQKLSMDLAPLIDVVFQLLVFFMLTSTFANPAIKLELPKAATDDASMNNRRIIVSVDESGQLFVNDEQTDFGAFHAAITHALADSAEKTVFVRGHKDMPYETFVRIMDQSKQAGAAQINILHRQE